MHMYLLPEDNSNDKINNADNNVMKAINYKEQDIYQLSSTLRSITQLFYKGKKNNDAHSNSQLSFLLYYSD